MAGNRRIETTNVAGSAGNVTLVRFVDRKIIDATNIQEMGEELFELAQRDDVSNIILNFANVEFLSSAALNKLIMLERKVKAHRGKLRLCNLRPEIFEVFAITSLTTLFDIKATEADALANF